MDNNQLFESFKQKRILIIGDVMVDAYLYGRVSRISPEAPVPIVNFQKSEERLGGAANVALNIASMGATPILMSVIGKDDAAKTIFNLLDQHDLSKEGLIDSEGRTTTIKTRVMGNHQHLLRVDREDITPINTKEESELLQRISNACKKGIDAIIFEDYNKGVLTPTLIKEAIKIAKKLNIPTTVDPKKDNFLEYKGVTLFKPNFKELKEGLGVEFSFEKGKKFEDAVEQLNKEIQAGMIFVTLSEHGVFIRSNDEKHYINAHYRNIADVSGAGDTVISIATLCLAADVELEWIAKIANLAGGLVCEKVGVVSINALELLNEMNKNNC